MKLRYQMRGLGIGIIVTALLMGVATKDGIPLSDAEIKAKALELGMVESDSLKLTDIGNGAPTPGHTTTPPVENSAVPEGKSTNIPDTLPTETPIAGTSEPLQASATPSGQVQRENGMVTIVIESGEIASEVSKKVAEAGLVADAGAFENYLCEIGCTRSIIDGTYVIPMGTSMEEIAKKIAVIQTTVQPLEQEEHIEDTEDADDTD